jgi:hypothetical protein
MVEESEAVFWSTWGPYINPDLAENYQIALRYFADLYPDLASQRMDLLEIAKGRDTANALRCLKTELPGVAEAPVYRFRQRTAEGGPFWLAMRLPAHIEAHPRPFVYLVDHFENLRENALWFDRRCAAAGQEVVMDLAGNVLRARDIAVSPEAVP